MYTKLTLSVEEDVIEAAKQYAHNKKTSLSKLVENFLRSVAEIKPYRASLVKSEDIVSDLRGVYKVSRDFDEKKVLTRALRKKHLK